jgi:endonuclease/exonuclease/phosphatase (EEP) superfamily protein YafD
VDDQTDKSEDKPPRRATLLVNLLAVCVGALLIFTLVGFAGAWYWFFDLFAHFRVQYVVALVGLTALTALLRAWRTTGAGLLGLLLNAAVIVPLYLPGEAAEPVADAPPLKIVAFNIRRRNRQFDNVAQYLASQEPDLIVLEEVDAAWIEAISARLLDYRLVAGTGLDNNFGIAMWMRLDAETSGHLAVQEASVQMWTAGYAEIDVVEARFLWNNRTVAFLGIHTIPPASQAAAASRDSQLAQVAAWTVDQQQAGAATIVAGDFNATPWSHAFRSSLRDGRLVDSQGGFGVQATWHRNYPSLAGIPIDHCLHSNDLRTIERAVDPADYGSDHRPLAVTLQWIAKE